MHSAVLKIGRLKDFRAIATRYDKLAKTFLAGVQLACATILLK
jgi:transposase